MYIYIYIYMRVYIYICIYVYILYMYVYACILVYVYKESLVSPRALARSLALALEQDSMGGGAKTWLRRFLDRPDSPGTKR